MWFKKTTFIKNIFFKIFIKIIFFTSTKLLQKPLKNSFSSERSSNEMRWLINHIVLFTVSQSHFGKQPLSSPHGRRAWLLELYFIAQNFDKIHNSDFFYFKNVHVFCFESKLFVLLYKKKKQTREEKLE